MTGTIKQQQLQMDQQQESLREIKDAQQSQLKLIKSILSLLKQSDRTTVNNQNDANGLYHQITQQTQLGSQRHSVDGTENGNEEASDDKK